MHAVLRSSLSAIVAVTCFVGPAPAVDLLGTTPDGPVVVPSAAAASVPTASRITSITDGNGTRPVDLTLLDVDGQAMVRPSDVGQLVPGATVYANATGNRFVVVQPDGRHLTFTVVGDRLGLEFMGHIVDTGLRVHRTGDQTYVPLDALAALFGQRFTALPATSGYEQSGLTERPAWLTDAWNRSLAASGARQHADAIAAEGAQPTGRVFENITATVFSSEDTGKKGAYGEYLSPGELYVALPCRFSGRRPRVAVRKSGGGGQTLVAPIKDVGPWNIDDPYWQRGARPQAEQGRDNTGRTTNRAGIDLSNELGRRLGIGGKGTVDWWFVD